MELHLSSNLLIKALLVNKFINILKLSEAGYNFEEITHEFAIHIQIKLIFFG